MAHKIMQIFLITITLTKISTQPPTQIRIIDLNKNPGLVIIENEKSFLKIGQHRLFHIIDLKEYEPILKKLFTNINGLRHFKNFTDMASLLEQKYSNTETLFSNLYPRSRVRRGLLNFIGSGIKQITGNMDHEDFIIISHTLHNLQKNSRMLINENNEQSKINLKLQNRLNDVINELNKQQIQITKSIINTRFENNFNQYFTLIKEIFKINFSLDQLNAHLQDIFESIQLAKLNIISKHILAPEETGFVVEKLKEQNIQIISNDQVYQFLEVSAFYNQSKIIFIVSIPLVSKSIFKKYLLEPVPVGDREIKLQYTSAIQDDIRTYFIIKECQRIESNSLCEPNQLLDVTNDACYSRLLRGISGNCTMIQASKSIGVKKLTSNHVILKNVINLEINSNCGITPRNLTGTYLIELHNCSAQINGTKYENDEKTTRELPLLIPLEGLEVYQEQLETVPSIIQEIHIHNRRQLEDFTKNHRFQTYTTISMSLCGVVFGICIILTWMFKKFTTNRKSSIHLTNLEVTTKQPKNIVPGRSDLRGGAVMNGPIPPSSTLASAAPIVTGKRYQIADIARPKNNIVSPVVSVSTSTSGAK